MHVRRTFGGETMRKYWEKSEKQIVFSFRIDANTYELVKEIAKKKRRSINSQLLLFVEDGISEYLTEREGK